MAATQDIGKRAMLVSLNISMWTGSVCDKVVRNEVTLSKCASEDTGNWTTKLIPKAATRGVSIARWQLSMAHKQITLPWNEGGVRILPAAMFDKYNESLSIAEKNFSDAVDQFLLDYPSYVDSAPERLGELLSTVRMPSVDEVREKFGVERLVLPMPSSNDFRVDLGDANNNRVKRNMDKSIEEMTKKAVGSLWEQMNTTVAKIAKTLGDKDAKFKDSLIGNLTDLCNMIPALNITDDPKLEQMRKECLEKLAQLKPASLRKQPRTRKNAAQAAADILDSIRKIDLDI